MKQLADADKAIIVEKLYFALTAKLVIEEIATKFELSESFV